MAVRTALRAILSALSLSLLLAVSGCDFDSGFEAGALNPNAMYSASVVGSVGDGPIVGAALQVFSSSGELLMTTSSDNTADYSLSIRTQGRNFPLTIVADGGTDIVTWREPDFKLVTTVMKPGNGQTANLNPYSTLIVKAAQNAGGITEESIAKATEAVVSRFGFGLDPALVPDPLFTPMDESNVHLIVKASETVGEVIRRARDAVTAAGTYVDGNDVVKALAADLVDGWVDGRGAEGYDRRISAVAIVASGAVMLEAMANQLHVYGIDATRYMDDAIRQVRPNAPESSNTRNVSIPKEALDQSLRSLRAAKVVKNDSRITEIYDAVAEAEPGATELDALSSGIQTMSSGFHNPLNDVVLATAFLSDETKLDEINSSEGPGKDPGDNSNPDDTEKEETGNEDSDNTKIDEPAQEEEGPAGGDEPIKNDDKKTNDETAQEDSNETGTGGGSSGTDSGGDSNHSGDTSLEPAPDTLWKNGGWLLFDGVNDMLNTGLSLTELGAGSFTFEAALQFTGEISGPRSPVFGSSAETYSWEQFLNIGKVDGSDTLRINIGGLQSLDVAGTNLFDGNERHLAVVFDRDRQTLSVFVDRELADRQAVLEGAFTATNDLLLGGLGHRSEARWDGWIGPSRVSGFAREVHELLGSESHPLEPRPNKPPLISGAPSTTVLMVGEPWSFTPEASDPDGDALTFSIDNQPKWAEFDEETGRIWGTPHAAGSYRSITITVEDAYGASASLDSFTLQVDEPTLGTATVSWEPPTQRTDGSALTDLVGYRVYYGKDANNLSHTIVIDNEGQTSQHIENLDSGTWYFAVTAVCSKGLESPKSEIGSKTI